MDRLRCNAYGQTGRRGKPPSGPDMAVQRAIKNEIPANYVTRGDRVRKYAVNFYKAFSLTKEIVIEVIEITGRIS